MSIGRTVDFLNGSDKYDVQCEVFLPEENSSFHASAVKQTSSSGKEEYSRMSAESANTHDREYAGALFEDFVPPPIARVDSTIPSRSNSTMAEPHLQIHLTAPFQSESLMELCTQLTLETTANQVTPGSLSTPHDLTQGLESADASWNSNSVAQQQPEYESQSPNGVQQRRSIINCNSCSSPRTDSPVLQWIIARLEDWQHHLNRLPTAGTAPQHLHNIATALFQLEEEVKLIRENLVSHSAEPGDDGIRSAVGCGNDDSRLVAQTLIIHVSSNTFLFSFDQLCYYMEELQAWILGSALSDSVVFWHYERDKEGIFREKPDAYAVLPHTDIAHLRGTDAYKFVNSVNRVEDDTIFRVHTLLVRQQFGSNEMRDVQ